MQYIVFDLEFNQDIPSLNSLNEGKSRCPFEIIQIGAIKLDINLNTVATFNRYVKPTIYSEINPFITELTGITTDQLLLEVSFPEIYTAFIEFIDESDSVFCVWGMSDIKELFRNAAYHQLDQKLMPGMFINLQPLVSTHFGIPKKNLFKLQNAVEALHIQIIHAFHNALHDAYYTAEIFKKINDSEIQPKRYDPNYVIIRPRPPKKVFHFEKLIQQFEKMYARKITEEEQGMIELAYKMGKTNQFLK